MEKAKLFLRSLKAWQIFLASGAALLLIFSLIFVAPYLRQSAKIKLGSDAGLVITADRQDTLGAFTDTKFTLKSDKDLKISDVKGIITFFPEIEFDVQEVSARQFSITPKTPLKNNAMYRIKVLAEAKTYSWAFQTKNDFRVVQTLPTDKGTYVPVNSGIEVTFSHDNWEDIGFKENNFDIKPFAEGRFERHKRTLSFVPKALTPNTLYTVTIKKGLKLNGSNDILKQDFVFKFETRAKEGSQASLGFARNFFEFSLSEIPAFDVYTGGMDASQNLDIKIYKYPSLQGFYSDFQTKLSIPSWASNSNRTQTFVTSGLSKVLEFSTPIQKQTYINYFLLPQTLDRGYYLVEAKTGSVISQALFQITDLSAYLSVSGTKTLVWVNNISTKSPVENADVSFAGKGAKTGPDGVAYFETPSYNPNENLGIIDINVGTGDNHLLLPPQSVMYYGNGDYLTGRRLADKYWSYLYLDRPTYLPQDTVKFWGLLRDRDDLNKKQKFTVEVTRSDYTGWDFTPIILYTKDLETSDMGTFLSEIPLTNFTPGYYGVVIKVNNNIVLSSSISVETYTKPAYEISIDSSKKAMFSDETATLFGKATFFEGTPVSRMSLKHTGGGSEGNVVTDNQGNYSFKFTPAPTSALDYPPDVQNFNIMPARPEEGLIQSGTSIAVYGSSLIFGNQKQDISGNTGKVDLNLRWVDTAKYSQFSAPEDIFPPAASRKITGIVNEVQYVKREVGTYYDFINKTTSPRYEYDRVVTKVADISLDTDQNGKASLSQSLVSGKSYELLFQSADDRGRFASQRVYLYANSGGYPQDQFVYLKTDKTGEKSDTYAVNEKVNLTMMKGDSPLVAGENSRFLYLWAQRGIKSYQVGNKANYSFVFPEAFIPSVTVSAIHFTGKTYEVAENMNLNFDNSSKKISLNVTQDKSSYSPGDTAKVSVSTVNSSGSPVSSEVNLNLVDEAYYKLFPQIANPLSQIYRSLNSDIIASYHSHQYPIGGGGAEMGGCFLPGTQILMSDGSSKSIEKIVAGDSIKTLQNSTSGKLVTAKVIDTYIHKVVGYLLINNHLRVTPEHNLYINGRWMTAGEARIGDEYMDTQGGYKQIISIEKLSGLNTVYNLSVENQHTFIAEGFYVHNDKGRQLFADNAFFGTVKTGIDGKGSVDIKLPDNLTSWRITSQAISDSLMAGAATNPLVVKQPFFVDAVLNTEYLTADRPTIMVRAFGEDLAAGEAVNISVQIPTLEIDKQIQAKAFEPVQINLGSLKAGDHKITITANSSKHTDKLIRSFKVIDSRLTIAKSVNMNLAADTVPTGSVDSYTKLVFSDQSLGRFYPSLISLSYSLGDRLDQKLGRVISGELLKKYFDNSFAVDKLDPSIFQTQDGGYALFPYSGTDLTLSAYVAALAADKVDSVGLGNYLYRAFSEAKDTDTASIALFGLASLDEPVLLLVNSLSTTQGLSPMAQIYLAMASAKLGDTENASFKFNALIQNYAKMQDNLLYMQVGDNKDSYLEATSTMTALGALVGASETDNLFAYTVSNYTKDILLTSTQILAIKSKLENNTPSAVKFAYTLDGKKVSKSLEKGESFTLMLAPSQLPLIKFSDLNGNVGLSTSFTIPLDPATAEVNKSVSVKRTYSVSDKTTTNFAATDLIKISLSPAMTELSQDGCYQVSDLLPSGLKPITSPYSLGLSSADVWYPYEINGQKVSFCIGKGNTTKPINYYARVISAGDYKSESALIQSLISPSVYNLSTPASVSIK